MCDLTIYTCEACGNKNRTEWLSCQGKCGQGPNCQQPYFRNLIWVDRCNQCNPLKNPNEKEGSYWDIPHHLLPEYDEEPVKWKGRTYKFFHSVGRYTWGSPLWKNNGRGQLIYYNFDQETESYVRMRQDSKHSSRRSVESAQKNGKENKTTKDASNNDAKSK